MLQQWTETLHTFYNDDDDDDDEDFQVRAELRHLRRSALWAIYFSICWIQELSSAFSVV